MNLIIDVILMLFKRRGDTHTTTLCFVLSLSLDLVNGVTQLLEHRYGNTYVHSRREREKHWGNKKGEISENANIHT